MNKKLVLYSTLVLGFATAITAIGISGSNQMNKLRAGSGTNADPYKIVLTSGNVKNKNWESEEYTYYFDLIGETEQNHDEFRSAEEYCYLYLGSGNELDVTFGDGYIASITDTSGYYGGSQFYIWFNFQEGPAHFKKAYAQTSYSDNPVPLEADSGGYLFSYVLPNNGTATLYSITFEYTC